MKNAQPQQTIYLKDYQPPSHTINSIDLDFDLVPDATRVTATLRIERAQDGTPDLQLNGENMKLISVQVDGHDLDEGKYTVTDTHLTLKAPPQTFTLKTVVEINPQANTALEGLYMSAGRFCTQCEAEGFRHITYMLDRPDVLTTYTVRLTADKDQFPTLLSNGNLIKSGDLDDGRHFAQWRDPFPKPSYLFALVGGTYDVFEDSFTTCTGRDIPLKIYVDVGEAHKAEYAMDALKRSMKWDEDAFGREYDLDLFMIVAVRDFNFGAMENKGLNIFNSAYLLADPKLATDADYEAIEGIVAHEYFHNWTGNRITCRDWFQLCLKEGLTVYRDQEFSASQRGAAVNRIKDVRALRARQFPEDAGPLAHPVRPDQFVEINNFYTATVYEKGSELIRMLALILGQDTFRKGMDLYFDRHDGDATTIESFLACFAEVSGKDLKPFKQWYHQAGRPRVHLKTEWDADAGTLTLHASQQTPPTPGQPDKKPMVIPIRTGLVNAAGKTVHKDVLMLDTADKTWTFDGLDDEPAVSALRGFSAPVTLAFDQAQHLKDRLMSHDDDWFNRWEHQQGAIIDLVLHYAGITLLDDQAARLQSLVTALQTTLDNGDIDDAFKALCLGVPTETELAQHVDPVDPDAILQGRNTLRHHLATALSTRLLDIAGGDLPAFTPDADAAGKRALRNAARGALAVLGGAEVTDMLAQQYGVADNMTDEMGALSALQIIGGAAYDKALETFYDRYQFEPLVVDKWFALQARDSNMSADRIAKLTKHAAFDGGNPNRLRSVIHVFANFNPTQFHSTDGAGYRLVADWIIKTDPKNAALAARLAGTFEAWKQYDEHRQSLAKQELERILSTDNLSKNTAEIVGKILG